MADTVDTIGLDLKASVAALQATLRNVAASSTEADVAVDSTQSKYFVRAFEGGQANFGLLITDKIIRGLPADDADRFFHLFEDYGNGPDPILLPIEIKSFAYTTKYQAAEHETDTKCMAARVSLSHPQMRNCQALVIVSMADPEYLALLPSTYFPNIIQNGKESYISFGKTPMPMVPANPLPPLLAPFVMHRDMLEAAFDNMVAYTQDPNVKLCNPFSGLQYDRSLKARTLPFSILEAGNSTEARIRHKLWTIFNKPSPAGITLEFRIQNPTHALHTHNIRLDHIGGVRLFLELQAGHVKVQDLPSGGQRLMHRGHASHLGRAIFTYECTMDYLLTMIDENEGYLILKEDIPRSWWHQNVDVDGFLTHDYLNHDFLNAHRIFLNEPAQLTSAFNQIMKGLHATVSDLPHKSTMHAVDILKLAGPCPALLLKGYVNACDPTNDTVDTTTVLKRDDEETEEECDPGVRSIADSEIVTTSRQSQSARKAEPEIILYSRLFLPLMKECRRLGKGCVLDLGEHHPMGRIGMIRYAWTEEDKSRYDKTGHPPRWIGMLATNVAMVTMHVVFSRSRYGYVSIEGLPDNLLKYQDSHPCLVVMTPTSKDTGNSNAGRWVVPSELMPDIDIGEVNNSDQAISVMLYLKDQMDIKRLAIAEEDMHSTLYKFLSSDRTIKIGLDNVEFGPGKYLKSIRDFKLSTDINYNLCAVGMQKMRAMNL